MSKHYPQKETKQRHMKPDAPKRPARAAASPTLMHAQTDLGLEKASLIQDGAAFALFVAACILRVEGWVVLAVFAVPLLAALYGVLMRAIEQLAAGNYLDDSIPAIVAAVAVFAAGDYRGGAALMLLYRAAKLIEAFCHKLAGKMCDEMKIPMPDEVLIENERGLLEKTELEKVAVGDIMAVAEGDILALDGVVVKGMSALDPSPLTDSSESYTVARGSRVFSGCVNIDAPLRIRVTRNFHDSFARRIADISEDAARYKSGYEKRVDKFAAVFTPLVSAAALVLAVLPPILTGEWRAWICRAGVLLALGNTAVYSAVSALGFLGGVATSARRGVVIKGTRFVEALARTKTMIFNKTGTISEGRCTIVDIEPVGLTDYDLLLTAARAEQYSPHPVARAICAACGSFERDSRESVKTESIPGRGISTLVRGDHIYVGNAALLEEHGVHCEVPRRGGAAIHVAVNSKYCGYFIVSDKVREGAFDALEELRVLGVKNTVLLTGDVRSIARPVASSLNFDMVKPELTPESKVSAVEYILATKPERSSLAVVCDHASDLEALERADVGISIASLGSQAALNSADVLIMADELSRLPIAVRMAKLTYHASMQNAAIFVLGRCLLIALAVSGVFSAFTAAVFELVLSAALFANVYRTIYNK